MLRSQCSQYSCGVTSGNHSLGYVRDNNSAGTYHCTRSNRHPFKNKRTRSDKNVIANLHGFLNSCIRVHSIRNLKSMKVTIKNGDARADKTTAADFDLSSFRNCREGIVHESIITNYDFGNFCPCFNMARVAEVTRRLKYSDNNITSDLDLALPNCMYGLKYSQASAMQSVS